MQLVRIVTVNSLTNSFLNLHVLRFKHLNISGTEYSPLKILGLAFYTTLLNVSDIGTNSLANLFANSFAHFQLGTLNSEKNK